jgi:CHASE2 domain-containing sensor protein
VSWTASPYVGLEHFHEEDKDFFFGRDADRRRVIFNLRGSRLTLLCAESGVGKTSLLHAGVSARLKELAQHSHGETGYARYLPFLFSGWQQRSVGALIGKLETQSRSLVADGSELSLPRDDLDAALATLGERTGATPVLILDRFEDVLFTPDGDPELDDELVRCVTDERLRASFLVSVRQDALSLVDQRFKGRIPNILANVLHLDFLDEKAAQDAVVGPVRAFNRRLGDGETQRYVEPALVHEVIEQVRRGRVVVGEDAGEEQRPREPGPVETAYLQLVMRRLWDEELDAGSAVLRVSTLERLGGANRIVHAHLDDVMDRLPADQADAAAAALRFLLTSGGRKIALSTSELREFSEADEAALEPALEHLERERILRPVSSPDPQAARRREIFHDVLAPAILDWRRRHAEERRLGLERERGRRLEVRSRRLAALVIALASVLVAMGLYLWYPAPLQRLELASVDARFALRGDRPPDPDVVLVAVDDRTLGALAGPGATVLPRAEHGRLLRRVMGGEPAVVALDVIFEGRVDPAGDAALLSAMRAAGDRLVLPYDPGTSRADELRDGTRVMQPLLLGREDLRRQLRARFAYAGLPEDVDERHRRADYQVTFSPREDLPLVARVGAPDVFAPTLAFAAADVARGGGLRDRFDELPTAERRAWGGQSELTTWIDTEWPSGTVRRVSALDILQGRVEPSVLEGRSVVIGVVPHDSTDVHRAPLDGGDPVHGALVHAEALSTILRGSPLRDAGPPAEVATIVLLGALPALAFAALGLRWAVAAVAVVVAAYVVVAQLTFHEGHVLMASPPLAALALAAIGITALQLLRALRRRPVG